MFRVCSNELFMSPGLKHNELSLYITFCLVYNGYGELATKDFLKNRKKCKKCLTSLFSAVGSQNIKPFTVTNKSPTSSNTFDVYFPLVWKSKWIFLTDWFFSSKHWFRNSGSFLVVLLSSAWASSGPLVQLYQISWRGNSMEDQVLMGQAGNDTYQIYSHFIG